MFLEIKATLNLVLLGDVLMVLQTLTQQSTFTYNLLTSTKWSPSQSGVPRNRDSEGCLKRFWCTYIKEYLSLQARPCGLSDASPVTMVLLYLLILTSGDSYRLDMLPG